ncbi:hypothetical protein KI387_021650, partial [Taxus chinensis]
RSLSICHFILKISTRSSPIQSSIHLWFILGQQYHRILISDVLFNPQILGTAQCTSIGVAIL